MSDKPVVSIFRQKNNSCLQNGKWLKQEKTNTNIQKNKMQIPWGLQNFFSGLVLL